MKHYEKYKTAEELHVPEIFDPIGNMIRFGFTEEIKVDEDGEEHTIQVGYCIPITGYIDYGHIKSQIIEYVYPQKDELALLNNAVAALLKERAGITAEQDESIEEDIQAFMEFNEWRDIAAQAARDLVNKFKQ